MRFALTIEDLFGRDWTLRVGPSRAEASHEALNAAALILPRLLRDPNRRYFADFERLFALCAEASLDPVWDLGLVHALETEEDLRRLEADLVESLHRAVRAGRLSIERTPPPQPPDWEPSPRERPRTVPAVPVGPELTWFEARVVDSLGRPVSGLDLVLVRGAHRQTTNAAGRARWEGLEGDGSLTRVHLVTLTAQRERLLREWGREPKGPEIRPEGTRVSVWAEEAEVQIRCEEPLTIVLENPVRRVRLLGMHFDTNKCFLRESAMQGVRRVVDAYRAYPTGTLVVAGHTDASGSEAFNSELSLERAEAVAAYLRDDVAAWEAWFGEGKEPGKRWGAGEIAAMLHVLPGGETIRGFQLWSNDARGTSLKVDGVAGEATRRALITAYMELDGTSVPKDVKLIPYGCGEYFPRPEEDVDRGLSTGGAADDRRVDIFCFRGEPQPPVPGRRARKASPEYAIWCQQVTEEIDFEAASSVLLVVDDLTQRPMHGVTVHVKNATGEVRSYVSDDNGNVTVRANRGEVLSVAGVEHATHLALTRVTDA